MVYPRTEMCELLEITNCGNRENGCINIQFEAPETEFSKQNNFGLHP